jgi:hypothetical protein
MGAARTPAAEEDEDEDEDEEAIRLLHECLFQYLDKRLDPRAKMSQLQSNMAGERAQNKADKRKLVRLAAPSLLGLPSQPSVVSPPPLPCSSDEETRSTRAATPSLPSGCLRRAFTLVSRHAWQEEEKEQERKRRHGAEQQLRQESGSMLKTPSQQHALFEQHALTAAGPLNRAPARLPCLLRARLLRAPP